MFGVPKAFDCMEEHVSILPYKANFQKVLKEQVLMHDVLTFKT